MFSKVHYITFSLLFLCQIKAIVLGRDSRFKLINSFDATRGENARYFLL